MTVMIETSALKERLHEYVKAPFVKISQDGNMIILIPEPQEKPQTCGSRLLGRLSSPTNVADELIATRHADQPIRAAVVGQGGAVRAVQFGQYLVRQGLA